MTQTSFNPGEVYLLVSNQATNSRVKRYQHQYNGLACTQAGLSGNLMFLGLSDSWVFNPNWWYDNWIRIDEKTGGKFWIRVNYHTYKRNENNLQKLEKYLQDSKRKIYSPKVVKTLQKQIDLLTKNLFYKVLINIDEPNNITEALVPVRIFKTKEMFDDPLPYWESNYVYSETNINHGYILWQNCD